MRKAMIVWGGWPGHDPDLCASMIRGWLKKEGFDVRIETATAAFADPAIHDLSLIIPIYTMSTIEKAEALNLCAAVRGGVGLAGHHGGMCDAFRDSVDYQFLCGGQWVAHPGNIIDYKVDLTKPDRGLEVSSTAPNNITCMSIRPMTCWRPRPLPASTPPGSRAS
jgi:type 1 glutamine amidotransferase